VHAEVLLVVTGSDVVADVVAELLERGTELDERGATLRQVAAPHVDLDRQRGVDEGHLLSVVHFDEASAGLAVGRSTGTVRSVAAGHALEADGVGLWWESDAAAHACWWGTVLVEGLLLESERSSADAVSGSGSVGAWRAATGESSILVLTSEVAASASELALVDIPAASAGRHQTTLATTLERSPRVLTHLSHCARVSVALVDILTATAVAAGHVSATAHTSEGSWKILTSSTTVADSVSAFVNVDA